MSESTSEYQFSNNHPVFVENVFHMSDKSVKSVTSQNNVSKNENFCDKKSVFDDGLLNHDHEMSTECEIILSVYWKRGKLGAAYYNNYEAELHILNDIVDIHPDFKNLRCLLNQVQYSQIISCSNLSDSFLNTLRELVNENIVNTLSETEISNGTSDDHDTNRKLHFMPGKKKDFNYDSCKRYILGYRFDFEPAFASEEDHLLFINSYLDFKKESMVMSLGVLLKYLKKYLPQVNLNHDSLHINMLHQINLKNIVFIDEASYKALQIFNVMHHPSAFKKSNSGSNREGLSIFGIFNRCKSSIGVKKMRQIFTYPIKNMDELNDRFEAIEFCCKPQHEHIVKNISDCIKKVEGVMSIFTSIYRSRSNMNHWKSLYTSLYNAILIGQICSTHSAHSELFSKISGSITKNVHEVAHYVNHIIDFEGSFLRNQFTVRAGIDKRLDIMRETYAQVPEVLLKVAELELQDLPEHIRECSIVYITELGYLLSIPIWKGEGTNVRGYEIPGFEVKFIVNKYVHYKTPRCTELDNALGDILAAMCHIESKIMVALIQFIHERVPDIVRLIDLIAELDCIIAMAYTALENNYNRPLLTNERKLEIIKGRHPLQELCVENFIPNDTIFSPGSGTITILTGPNSSGKSVYLKQIALIAYLAHIGSFVPAEKAEIGILDHIHSRINTLESISTRMSSFILDLKQMSQALYNSTASSLVIIDEFGKGTTEIDGLSLLAASLIHFINRGENCPYVLVSTHFHTIPKLLPQSSLISLQCMDYVIENDEIIYLYRIKNGSCKISLTHMAAKNAGLSEKSSGRFLEIFSQSEQSLKCNPNLRITRNMLREVKETIQILNAENYQEHFLKEFLERLKNRNNENLF